MSEQGSDSPALPQAIVLAAILLHACVWTFVPSLVNPNLPLDVIEGLAWGHAWQLGYDKHPPLSAWLLELASWVEPGSDWQIYLLSALCVAVAFWAVWRLARDFLSPARAGLAVLLMQGVYYHNFTIPEFNPNVLQLPLWALSVLCFWRALSRGSLVAWGLFGLFGALGLLTKYFTAFLILPLGLYLLLEPQARQAWRTRGPYLAMGVALAVLMPHLVWLALNEFQTIAYALGRSSALSDSAWVKHLRYPLQFVLAQVLAGIAVAVLLFSLGRPTWSRSVEGPQFRFLFAVAIVPLLLVVAVSAGLGLRLRSMWGAPLLIFMPLFVLALFRVEAPKVRRFAVAWFAVFLLAPALYAGLALFQPYATDEGKRVHFPGRTLAQHVEADWRLRYARPLRIAIGSEWIAGNIGAYASSRPQVFIDGDVSRSAWLDDARVRSEGAVVVWEIEDADQAQTGIPFGLAARFDCVVPVPAITLDWETGAKVPPLRFGLAYIAPEDQCPQG